MSHKLGKTILTAFTCSRSYSGRWRIVHQGILCGRRDDRSRFGNGIGRDWRRRRYW